MSNKRIRLKDLALQLNVSIPTVSRALKDRPDISPELKEKIKTLANNLHYQPNAMAAQFKNQQNRCIGVIIPRVAHFFFSTIISGILQEAAGQDYRVVICQTLHDYLQEVKFVHQLSNGTNDGLLICIGNNTTDIAHLTQLAEDNLPFVLFDKDVSKLKVPKVVVDDFTGAFFAVEHLIKQGYRHIAHIQDNGVAHTSQKRLKGYLSALKKYKLPQDADLVVQTKEVSTERGNEAMSDLLRSGKTVDAVFGITDEIAIGAMKAAMNLGLRVPEDFGVVGFSDWQIASVVTPPLSTVAQPGFEMGQIAAKMLISMIEKDKTTTDNAQVRILKTRLIVRESSFRSLI
ncbi:MAG: LacI family DNA-binding transcriptional regulator [Saprospiraceae bacterium]|nr:LacI family DNA-binding transcriptional regulator [Saprospiraceae bacterium]